MHARIFEYKVYTDLVHNAMFCHSYSMCCSNGKFIVHTTNNTHRVSTARTVMVPTQGEAWMLTKSLASTNGHGDFLWGKQQACSHPREGISETLSITLEHVYLYSKVTTYMFMSN